MSTLIRSVVRAPVTLRTKTLEAGLALCFMALAAPAFLRTLHVPVV